MERELSCNFHVKCTRQLDEKLRRSLAKWPCAKGSSAFFRYHEGNSESCQISLMPAHYLEVEFASVSRPILVNISHPRTGRNQDLTLKLVRFIITWFTSAWGIASAKTVHCHCQTLISLQMASSRFWGQSCSVNQDETIGNFDEWGGVGESGESMLLQVVYLGKKPLIWMCCTNALHQPWSKVFRAQRISPSVVDGGPSDLGAFHNYAQSDKIISLNLVCRALIPIMPKVAETGRIGKAECFWRVSTMLVGSFKRSTLLATTIACFCGRISLYKASSSCRPSEISRRNFPTGNLNTNSMIIKDHRLHLQLGLISNCLSHRSRGIERIGRGLIQIMWCTWSEDKPVKKI